MISTKTPVYPGDPALAIEFVARAETDHYTLSRISTGMHVGTHLDAPLHFLPRGETIADLELERLAGPAVKIRVTPVDGHISTKRIREQWNPLEQKPGILLLETGHDRLFGTAAFFTDCPDFDPELKSFLLENKITLFGLDLPTVKYPEGNNLQTHLDLLGNNILIVESLANLSVLEKEAYFMALPLAIEGLEASPVRAVAFVDD